MKRSNYDSIDNMETGTVQSFPGTEPDGSRRFTFGTFGKKAYVAGAHADNLQGLEELISLVDRFSLTAARAFFGFCRLIFAPFVNFYLEMINFFLWGIQKVFVEPLPFMYDQILKPLLWIGYTYGLLPFATYAWNFFEILLNQTTLHMVLNSIVDAICRMLSSIKLVELNYGGASSSSAPSIPSAPAAPARESSRPKGYTDLDDEGAV